MEALWCMEHSKVAVPDSTYVVGLLFRSLESRGPGDLSQLSGLQILGTLQKPLCQLDS